jgi:hypothetical protein
MFLRPGKEVSGQLHVFLEADHRHFASFVAHPHMHAEVYIWFVVRPHKPFHVRFGSISANLQSTYEIF